MEDMITTLYLQKQIILFQGKKLWKLFEVEMLGQETKNWLYNGDEAPNGNADLGYFIGYEICKSYYENSKNKKISDSNKKGDLNEGFYNI